MSPCPRRSVEIVRPRCHCQRIPSNSRACASQLRRTSLYNYGHIFKLRKPRLRTAAKGQFVHLCACQPSSPTSVSSFEVTGTAAETWAAQVWSRRGSGNRNRRLRTRQCLVACVKQDLCFTQFSLKCCYLFCGVSARTPEIISASPWASVGSIFRNVRRRLFLLCLTRELSVWPVSEARLSLCAVGGASGFTLDCASVLPAIVTANAEVNKKRSINMPFRSNS